MTLEEQLAAMDRDQLMKVAVVLEDRLMKKEAAETFYKIGHDLCDAMVKESAGAGFLSKAWQQAKAVGSSMSKAFQKGKVKAKTPTGKVRMKGGKAVYEPSVMAGMGGARKKLFEGLSQNPELQKAVLGAGVGAAGIGAAGAYGLGHLSGGRNVSVVHER